MINKIDIILDDKIMTKEKKRNKTEFLSNGLEASDFPNDDINKEYDTDKNEYY